MIYDPQADKFLPIQTEYGCAGPATHDAECPTWGTWGDSRRCAVVCSTCRCIFTGRYWFPEVDAQKYPEGGRWTGGIPKDGCPVCSKEQAKARRRSKPIDPVLVAAVREHAAANYDEGGWDFIVETYTDAELWAVIAGCRTAKGAVTKAGAVARLLADRRSDICNA